MVEAMVHRCRPLLGTFVDIGVPLPFEEAIPQAFAAIAHVHARMSFHEDTSDLESIRRAPIGEPVKVDAQTAAVLRIAQRLYRRSQGLFDVAIGAELVRDGFLPLPPGISLVGMAGTTGDLEVTDNDHVICHAPMLIDLGGIAKGYAVDCAIGILADRGVPRAVVNAGGDLRILGQTAEIIHLREADDSIRLSIELADSALASSGNFGERRHRDGRITTPHRAWDHAPLIPADTVTVIAPRCVIADALTKVALADKSLATAMLEEMGGAIVERPHEAVAA